MVVGVAETYKIDIHNTRYSIYGYDYYLVNPIVINTFPVGYSLLPIGYSLFPIGYWLLATVFPIKACMRSPAYNGLWTASQAQKVRSL